MNFSIHHLSIETIQSYVELCFKVTNYELRYGKSNCSWASCREGCTASIYKCHQIRVVYTPEHGFKENMNANMFDQNSWADLSRIERPVSFFSSQHSILTNLKLVISVCSVVVVVVALIL